VLQEGELQEAFFRSPGELVGSDQYVRSLKTRMKWLARAALQVKDIEHHERKVKVIIIATAALPGPLPARGQEHVS
jgi:hypothetical protein